MDTADGRVIGRMLHEDGRPRTQKLIFYEISNGLLVFRQEQHGECPETLEKLVPLYTKALPVDAWGHPCGS